MTTLKELEDTQAQHQEQIAQTQQRLEQLVNETIFLSGRIAQLKECDEQQTQEDKE